MSFLTHIPQRITDRVLTSRSLWQEKKHRGKLVYCPRNFDREKVMSHTRHWTKLISCLRVILTVVAWVAFIVYAHHLSHVYLGEIKSVLGSGIAQVIVQVVVLSALIYFIMLSLPFLPNLGIRGISVLAMWSIILVLGHQLSHEGFHKLRDILASASGEIGIYGLSLGAFVYVLVLALPFVPGVEFGLLLMVLFGREGVIVAYVATIVGLSLAYLVAQTVPNRITLRWMNKWGLSEATDNPKDAIDAIAVGRSATRGAATRLGNFLASHRYLTLAVCLNLPGNSVLGGGGGIAALCGLSRQFYWWRYVLTLIIATAPIPLLVLVGQIEIEPMLEKHGILHDLLSRAAGILMHE
jgi:hypothetical protein